MNDSPINDYIEKRSYEYPPVGEQLDMLWHLLNTYGDLKATYKLEDGSTVLNPWFERLRLIKEDFPKPDIPPEE